MFDHVTIRAADREASEGFYELVLRSLGIEKTYADHQYAEWDDFSLAQESEDKLVTRRLHIGFTAPSREHVDAFWRAGTDAGFLDEGAPGLRPQYRQDYYGAFLLDPDGNSAEAVHHGGLRKGGVIDHLWIRVADVLVATRFFETVAPFAGFRLRRGTRNHAHFVGGSGSFSVVAGTPTEHVHMAFPTSDDETVEAFHRAAVATGYQDNGPPGERPIYHAGYYSAFVLDPDGNNIEVVNHNRD